MGRVTACAAEHTRSGEVHVCGRELGHRGDHHAGPGVTWPAMLGQTRQVTLGVVGDLGRTLGTLYPDGTAVVYLTVGDRPAELHLTAAQRAELLDAVLLPTEMVVPDEHDPDSHVVVTVPPVRRPGAHRRMPDTMPIPVPAEAQGGGRDAA
ncbi:hypothetical protein [Nocardiopsis sp. NPDC057823]|uniref:hypothetical protein n=1 Tax=Nocardiopsis sp. NPDC057823 TaxID=3346256 RepID=UPI00366E01E7